MHAKEFDSSLRVLLEPYRNEWGTRILHATNQARDIDWVYSVRCNGEKTYIASPYEDSLLYICREVGLAAAREGQTIETALVRASNLRIEEEGLLLKNDPQTQKDYQAFLERAQTEPASFTKSELHRLNDKIPALLSQFEKGSQDENHLTLAVAFLANQQGAPLEATLRFMLVNNQGSARVVWAIGENSRLFKRLWPEIFSRLSLDALNESESARAFRVCTAVGINNLYSQGYSLKKEHADVVSPILLRNLKSETDPIKQAYVIGALLQTIGPESPQLVPLLGEVARSDTHLCRSFAVRALNILRSPLLPEYRADQWVYDAQRRGVENTQGEGKAPSQVLSEFEYGGEKFWVKRFRSLDSKSFEGSSIAELFQNEYFFGHLTDRERDTLLQRLLTGRYVFDTQCYFAVNQKQEVVGALFLADAAIQSGIDVSQAGAAQIYNVIVRETERGKKIFSHLLSTAIDFGSSHLGVREFHARWRTMPATVTSNSAVDKSAFEAVTGYLTARRIPFEDLGAVDDPRFGSRTRHVVFSP